MRPSTAAELAEILGTVVAAGDPSANASGVVTSDSRSVPTGSIFFAIRGERFDGNQFAQMALDHGALIVVVSHWDGSCPAGTAAIVVPDTLLALQKFAHHWRRQLEIPVICITGSNGKTSTKDFTAAVLKQKFAVSATRGNFNNHIGLPLSVLATRPEHQAAVWEIGMNHAGELAPLCEIAMPKFGIITNIGSAHIEHLGTRDAIAEEKGTLARALPADGVLFLPANCEYFDYLRQRTKAQIVTVGNGRGLVRAENLQLHADRSDFSLVIEGAAQAQVSLPVAGRHMVGNALLAAAVGWKLGMNIEEIAAGLSTSSLSSGRLRRFTTGGVTVIDDSYNANPESMAAALETLAEMPAPAGASRFCVLGKMGELGALSPVAHVETGRLAATRGLQVVAVGEGAKGIADGADTAAYFPDFSDAAEWLSRHVKEGDVVLFKGSRAAAVERLMNTVFPQN